MGIVVKNHEWGLWCHEKLVEHQRIFILEDVALESRTGPRG